MTEKNQKNKIKFTNLTFVSSYANHHQKYIYK
jgi:hypothetical protein